MKKVILVLAAAMISTFAIMDNVNADVWVSGYVRSNGTYVAPHYRSSPNSSFYDNWSTKPNLNPYTGRIGTRVAPSYSTRSYRSYTPSYRSYSTPSYRSYTPSYRSYGTSSYGSYRSYSR